MEGGGDPSSQPTMDYIKGLLQECQFYIINHFEGQLEEIRTDLKKTFSVLHEKIESKDKQLNQIFNEQPLMSEREIASKQHRPIMEWLPSSEREKKKTPFLQRISKKDKRGAGKGGNISRLF